MRAFSLVFLLGLSFSSCSFSGASSWFMDSALASWAPASGIKSGEPTLRCGFDVGLRDEAKPEAQAAFLKLASGLWRNSLEGVVMELDREGRSSLSQGGILIDAKTLEFNLESVSVGTRNAEGLKNLGEQFEVLSHKTVSPGHIVYVGREDRQGFRFILIQTGAAGSLAAPGNCVAYELKTGVQSEGEPAVFLRGPIQNPAVVLKVATRGLSQVESQLFTR